MVSVHHLHTVTFISTCLQVNAAFLYKKDELPVGPSGFTVHEFMPQDDLKVLVSTDDESEGVLVCRWTVMATDTSPSFRLYLL